MEVQLYIFTNSTYLWHDSNHVLSTYSTSRSEARDLQGIPTERKKRKEGPVWGILLPKTFEFKVPTNSHFLHFPKDSYCKYKGEGYEGEVVFSSFFTLPWFDHNVSSSHIVHEWKDKGNTNTKTQTQIILSGNEEKTRFQLHARAFMHILSS